MSNWPSNIVVLVFECRHGLAGDLANQPSNVDVGVYFTKAWSERGNFYYFLRSSTRAWSERPFRNLLQTL